MRLNFTHVIAFLSLTVFTVFAHAQVPAGYTSQRIENVNFGTGANHFTIEAATEGTGGEVQIRLDAADGTVIGHAFFHHTGGANHYIDYECDLNQTVSGTHDVYMNILDYIDPITDKVLNTRDFQFKMVEDSPDIGDSLHVYPPVSGLDPSPYYEFKVQKLSELNSANFEDATNWETPFAWFTKNRKGAPNTEAYFKFTTGWSHTYCNFELDENTPIVVKITRKANTGDNAPSGPILAAAAHPARKVISCELINGDVYVTMENPAQVSIDIDGQLDSRDAPRKLSFPIWGGDFAPYGNVSDGVHSVSIFANPFIDDKPDPDGAGVKKVNPGDPLPADDGSWSTLYFMPGIHKMTPDGQEWRPEDIIDLNSNRTYYIPGDAIVYGNFNSMDPWGGTIDNVRLYGHGTVCGTKMPHFNDWSAELETMNVDHSFLRTFEVHGASNVIVEGITSSDPAEHGIYIYSGDNKNVNYVKWTKLITWRVNNDGMVVSGNSYVEDCFIRHQDDANYIEGAGMKRTILWTDVNGQPLRGSWIADRRSGSYPGGLPTVLNYDNIDVIYARATFGLGSVISGGSSVTKTYSDGVQNTGQHLLYSNINVEDKNPVRVLLGFSTGTEEAKALKGIRFKNINYQHEPAFNDDGNSDTPIAVNTLKGNANDDIQYFVFDNVYISGKQLDLNLMNDPKVFDAQYVSDITFRLHDTIFASGNVLIRTATNGTISIDTVPGSNQVTLTATPIDGFEFNGWSGDLSGKENPVTITVDRNMAITGKFDVFKYDIITTSDNGTISFNPPGGSYLPGTDVTVTATGDIGYDFESWGGDLSGTENSVTITMNSDKYITASYKLIQTYSLNLDTKYGSVVLNPPGGTYNEGSQVTLTPNPDIGYIFGEWGGDLSGSTAPQTITMDGDKTVTAKFMYTGQGSAGLALNCGGPQYTAADDVVYEASSNGATYSTTALISSTEDDTLYQTESFGGSLSYDFPLDNGPYEVTLKFAEIFFGSSGQRVFDVSIEGEVVLDNFDIVAEAGGKNIALDKTFTVTLLDGELNISLNAIQDNAKISAIQITNLPVEVEEHTLTTSALNGSITIDPATGPYPAGSNVTLEAAADAGYAFLGWAGDFSSFDNPAVLYMDGNKTVSALFDTEQTYSLTTITTNGVLDVTPDKGSYNPLEQVQLSVTPDAGYKFVGWQGDLSGTENPVTIYMNGDKNITANVVEIPTYTLSASGVNGTVSVDPVKASYLEGDQVTLSATANEGYRFTSWSGDLSGSVNPITITMDSNIVITADFTLIPIYTLTTLASNGTITLDPAGGSYEEGTSVSVTVTVDEGYQFDGWQGDLSGTGNPATVVMNGDKNITAGITKIPTYTLSVQGENGTVTVDPLKAEYLEGDQVTITATGDEGYHFSSWSGDLLGTTNPETISIDSNISITAVFETSASYTLSISSTNGSVTLDPPGGSYDEGTVVNLTATPNSGYEFFAWGGDISGSSMNTSITMTSNKSVIASFAPIASYTITTSATNGTIDLDPTGGSYIVGTVVTVKATPDEGYEFSNWSGDLSGNSVEETITVNSDKTISAIFSAITSTHELFADKDVSMQIYPNPFSTETTISYELSNSDRVSISIYNMMGQKVNVLVNETQNAGIHQVVWDASQSDGGQLPNGIYICRFETGDGISQTMRVVMTR